MKHVIIRGLSYIFDKKSLKSITIPRRDKTSIENQNTLFWGFLNSIIMEKNKKIAMRKKLRDEVYQTSIALLIVNLFHYIVISNITEFKKRLINIKAKSSQNSWIKNEKIWATENRGIIY